MTVTEIDYGFEQLLGPLPAAWPDGQHHHSFADDPWFVGGHPFTPRHAVIWGAATTVHAWAFMQVRSRFGSGHPALAGFPPYLLELAPGPGLETVVAGDRCPTQPRADPAQYLSDVVDAVLDMPGLEGHHLVVQPQPGAGLEYTFGLFTSDR